MRTRAFKKVPLPKPWLLAILLGVTALVIVGCRTMAPYDPTTDTLLTALQTTVDGLLADVTANVNTPAADYENYITDYQTITTELSVLRTRVMALPNNTLTIQEVALLQQSITLLQQRHQKGWHHRAELNALQHLIDSQFQSLLQLELAKPKNPP